MLVHKNGHIYQRKMYRRQIRKMTGNDRMVVMDYAKQETRSQGKVNIMTFSVVSKKSRKSDPDFQYSDYFFDSTKATDKDGDLRVDILASAWTAFLQQSEKQGLPLPERLFVWSDRGSTSPMALKLGERDCSSIVKNSPKSLETLVEA